MKLYHGSKRIIKNPRYKGSQPTNDYGPAFYLTRNKESAHEWACRNGNVGYVSTYDFRIDNLKILDLTDRTKYSILHWLTLLMFSKQMSTNFANENKQALDYLKQNYYLNPDDYDVIINEIYNNLYLFYLTYLLFQFYMCM